MSLKSIRDLVVSQKFMIKNKWSMFASRDVCIYFGNKRGVICAVTPKMNFTYTRCLLDILTWNVSSRWFLQFSYLMRPLFLASCVHVLLTNDERWPDVNLLIGPTLLQIVCSMLVQRS